jgi:hypothetical protein
VCVPTFADIEIDGESRTAIRLSVEDRTHRMPTGDGAAAVKDGTGVKDGAAVKDGVTATDGHRQPAPASI